MARLAEPKSGFRNDLASIRYYVRQAAAAVAAGEWEQYGDFMDAIEVIASASRAAARRNNGGEY